MIVYFSSVSGYTDRFVKKLGLPAVRIPLYPKREYMPVLESPKVLILPTYGGGPETRAVPKLLQPQANQMRGVRGRVGLGRRFGEVGADEG
jgi:protein involved in ribonucleotide reduction